MDDLTDINHTRNIDILDREVRYRGFFRIDRYRLRHRLFNGDWSRPLRREVFERGHAAAVLPYDPARDEVVLIEQFRIGALTAPGGAWLLEIVAGMIEEGEQAADVVIREGREEAGCNIEHLEPICDFLVSPGGTSERIALFCGKVDSSNLGGIHGLDTEDEDIRVTTVPFSEAIALLDKGEINSASPIIALQWLRQHRDTLRGKWLDKAK